MFTNLRPGDSVTRLLGGEVTMKLKVTDVDEEFVHCGDWKFRRDNGVEVDEELGWGVQQPDGTWYSGSYLREEP
jgi:hypothetical protein